MRTLIVALGLAALAAGPALAQSLSRGSSGSTAASTTSGTTASTTTSGTTSSTNGIAFTPLPGGASTDPGLSAAPSTGAANNNSGAGANTGAATGTSAVSSGTFTRDLNAATPGDPFAPGGSFSNDSGNTALGTSPGQTSSGTLAGNSSSGIGADSTALTGGIANTGTVTLVPEGNVSVIGGGGTGARVIGVPSAVSPQGTAPGSASSTPLFDQAARDGRAREARRRARGDEPRVYGIAPNTERDLTWQMPDDRIIRY